VLRDGVIEANGPRDEVTRQLAVAAGSPGNLTPIRAGGQ
jgi:hypothetical protein